MPDIKQTPCKHQALLSFDWELDTDIRNAYKSNHKNLVIS